MTTNNSQIVSVPYRYLTGCNLSFNGNKSLNLGIGQARDNTNSFDIPITSPIVIDATTNGINGLDVGGLQANLFYYVFLIGDSSKFNVYGCILSLSHLSPLLPNGYDLIRLIGSWNTDGSSNFRTMYQIGMGNDRRYIYDDITSSIVLRNGNSNVFSRVNLSSFVPAINNPCSSIILTELHTPVEGDTLFLRISGYIGDKTVEQIGYSELIDTNQEFEIPIFILSGIPSLEYRVSTISDSASLAIAEFTISL